MIKVWYDRKGDMLEVIFEDAPASMEEITDDVFERRTPDGRVVGCTVFNFSHHDHTVITLSARQMWTDYDAEADVLYISFRKPQQANDSIMEDDGNIYHYRDDELVGITALNASQKQGVNDS